MSHEKSFYQVFKCFSADKFDYDEDAVLFESENLGNCHNFAYQLWIEREDDNAFVTIIQPYDGSCRGGYGFPDEEEKPSQFEQLQARNAELEKEVARLKEIAIPVFIDYGDGAEEVAYGNVHQVRRLMKWLDKFFAQKQQLAIAEEHNARLLSALEAHHEDRLGKGRDPTHSLTKLMVSGYKLSLLGTITDEVLSLPASREALDKYVAEKVKEARKCSSN